MGSCGAGLSMVKYGWVREAWAGGMLEYLWGEIELGKPHVMVASKRVVILGLQHPISKKKTQHYKGSLVAHLHPGCHARASEAAACFISTPASDLLSHLRQVI